MQAWFGPGLRTRTAVEADKLLAHGAAGGARRKCFYDESTGDDDLRLKVPGVVWEDVRKVRRDIVENVRSNFKEAFDDLYDQIINDRRASINRHVLPTIKTPAMKRTKSRTQPPQPKSTTSPMAISPPPPPPNSNLNTSLSDTFTPQSASRMMMINSEEISTNDGDGKSCITHTQIENYASSSITNDKENVMDVVNTPSPKKMATRKRPKRGAKDRVNTLANDEGEVRRGRVTRSSVRGRGPTELPGSPSASQPLVRRSTRSRAAKTATTGKKMKPNALSVAHKLNDTTLYSEISTKNGGENEKVVTEHKMDLNDSCIISESTGDPSSKGSTMVRRSMRISNLQESKPRHEALKPAPPAKHCDNTSTSTTTSTTSSSQPHNSSRGQHKADGPLQQCGQPSSASSSSHPSTPPLSIDDSNQPKPDTPHPETSPHLHSSRNGNSSPQPFQSCDMTSRESEISTWLTPKNLHSSSSSSCAKHTSTDDVDGATTYISPSSRWCTRGVETILKKPSSSSFASSSIDMITPPTIKATSYNGPPAPREITNFIQPLEYDKEPSVRNPLRVFNPVRNNPREIPGVNVTGLQVSDIAEVEESHASPIVLEGEIKKKPRTPGSTDSGISSVQSNRERSGSSLTGLKRLRSVSLEKISLVGVDIKRVSLITESREDFSPTLGEEEEGEGEEKVCIVISSSEGSDGEHSSSGRSNTDEPMSTGALPTTDSEGSNVSSIMDTASQSSPREQTDDGINCSISPISTECIGTSDVSTSSPSHLSPCQPGSSSDPRTYSSPDDLDSSPDDRGPDSNPSNPNSSPDQRVQGSSGEEISPDNFTSERARNTPSSSSSSEEEGSSNGEQLHLRSEEEEELEEEEEEKELEEEEEEFNNDKQMERKFTTGCSTPPRTRTWLLPMQGNSPAVGTTTTKTPTGLGRSPLIEIKKTKGSPWATLSHKTHFHDVPLKDVLQSLDSRPVSTFLSPTSSPKGGAGKTNASGLPFSFLAKGSPQQLLKAQTKATRQRKLMEHLRRKREEEEQRRKELEEKRLQEIEQKKKRNAERAQKAAEKRKIEEQKKLIQRKKAQEQVNEQQMKQQVKLNRLRADERMEKSKKHNEKVAAVMARKKQEEEQKVRKLKQIEEDNRMAQELFKKRQEKEEEERQMKKAEKQEREKERLQTVREAEERERKLRELLVTEEKPDSPKVVPKPPKVAGPSIAGVKKQDFKQLLASTCVLNIPINPPRLIADWKNKLPATTSMGSGTSATITKPRPTIPLPLISDCPPPRQSHTTPPSPSSTTQPPSELNSTFTIETSTTEEHPTKATSSSSAILVTPNKPPGSATAVLNSYNMTPATLEDNYDIDNLSEGDSTDNEDSPKKPIPTWAMSQLLRNSITAQEEAIYRGDLDPSHIFPVQQLMQEIDLARIFRNKRKRFFHRTSSARWDSPVMQSAKRGRFDALASRLV